MGCTCSMAAKYSCYQRCRCLARPGLCCMRCMPQQDLTRAAVAWSQYRTTAEELGLSEIEFTDLFLQFRRACVAYADAGDELVYEQFMARSGLDSSKFAERVFKVLDYRNCGRINFRAFMVGLWNYCSCDELSLIRFAFALYDDEDAGVLKLSKLFQVLKDVYGNNKEKTDQLERALSKLVKGSDEDDPMVTDAQFLEFCRKSPRTLFPAFNLQRQLCAQFMGASFWHRVAARRSAAMQQKSDWKSQFAAFKSKIRRGSAAGDGSSSSPAPTSERRPSVSSNNSTSNQASGRRSSGSSPVRRMSGSGTDAAGGRSRRGSHGVGMQDLMQQDADDMDQVRAIEQASARRGSGVRRGSSHASPEGGSKISVSVSRHRDMLEEVDVSEASSSVGGNRRSSGVNASANSSTLRRATDQNMRRGSNASTSGKDRRVSLPGALNNERRRSDASESGAPAVSRASASRNPAHPDHWKTNAHGDTISTAKATAPHRKSAVGLGSGEVNETSLDQLAMARELAKERRRSSAAKGAAYAAGAGDH